MLKDKNIILVGFMGAGKTAVAKELEKQLGQKVVSTDELIVQAEARPITDIFQNSGEAYFRQIEKKVVKEISTSRGIIIDCGGGVVLDPENVLRLKESGILFYLQATPEEIFRRVQAESHRPLLNTPHPQQKIKELLGKRAAFYAQANHTIETTGKSVSEVCQEILAFMR